MNKVILCEGKTDAILISYFLYKVYGWEHDKKNKTRVPVLNEENTSVSWYKLNNDNLLVWGVGGKDCFQYAINKVLERSILNKENAFMKIIIIADRDKSNQDSIITNELIKSFREVDNFSNIENNKWTDVRLKDAFGDEFEINVSCSIIPFDKQGALETFLLDALSEDEDKKYIIEKVKGFIDNIESNKYIVTERLKLKAELAATLAILSPEKVFTEIDNMLKEVNWERYKTIQRGFAIFDQL